VTTSADARHGHRRRPLQAQIDPAHAERGHRQAQRVECEHAAIGLGHHPPAHRPHHRQHGGHGREAQGERPRHHGGGALGTGRGIGHARQLHAGIGNLREIQHHARGHGDDTVDLRAERAREVDGGAEGDEARQPFADRQGG
jgi:hypothetical protein